MVDHGLGPDALEQDVTKAQGHQVLHRLFAQIVVDPVDLRFIEGLSHGGVDFLARRQVVPERLLQNQAVLGTIEPDFGEESRYRPEQRRRGRQIDHTDPVRVLVELVLERAVAINGEGVVRHVGKSAQKAFQGVGIEVLFRDKLAQRRFDLRDEFRVAELGACDADNPRLIGQLAVELPVEQGGKQLAFGQVAGATNDDVVKGVNNDNLRHVR